MGGISQATFLTSGYYILFFGMILVYCMNNLEYFLWFLIHVFGEKRTMRKRSREEIEKMSDTYTYDLLLALLSWQSSESAKGNPHDSTVVQTNVHTLDS